MPARTTAPAIFASSEPEAVRTSAATMEYRLSAWWRPVRSVRRVVGIDCGRRHTSRRIDSLRLRATRPRRDSVGPSQDCAAPGWSAGSRATSARQFQPASEPADRVPGRDPPVKSHALASTQPRQLIPLRQSAARSSSSSCSPRSESSRDLQQPDVPKQRVEVSSDKCPRAGSVWCGVDAAGDDAACVVGGGDGGVLREVLDGGAGGGAGGVVGSAGGRAGTVGRVDAEALELLLSGRDPVSGTPLGRELLDRFTSDGRMIRAVSGFDATFSAPKSLSVWWALTGDRRLLEAHDVAVSAALAHLERFGSTTRIRPTAAGSTRTPTV